MVFIIVDIHTHIFPSEIAYNAVEKLKKISNTQSFSDGTSGGLLNSRQKAGIDCCLILPVVTDPKQVVHMNDRAIMTNTLYPETGLLSFGGIHPDYSDWKKELKRLSGSGVKGIKLHPIFQKVHLNDLRYLRIIEYAAELGMVTITHMGSDVDRPDAAFCSPEMAVQIYRDLGGIPLILAHMGGWRQWDDAERLAAQTPFYLDTAYCLGKIAPLERKKWTCGSLDIMPQEQFLRFVKAFGAERLLFGSDSPWRDQGQSLKAIRELPLSDKDKNAILGANAVKLLGI